MESDNPIIREMTHKDIPEVLRIERELFSDPWPESMFHDDIRSNYSHPYVAQIDNEIAGYAILWVAPDEGHLTNMAVAKSFQRKAIAKRLLVYILNIAAGMSLAQIVLEVRPSNQPAISLYESYGFEPLAIRKKYYRKPAEDCLVMRKLLNR